MVEFLNANLEKILFTPLPYFANDIKKARRPVATRLLVY